MKHRYSDPALQALVDQMCANVDATDVVIKDMRKTVEFLKRGDKVNNTPVPQRRTTDSGPVMGYVQGIGWTQVNS